MYKLNDEICDVTLFFTDNKKIKCHSNVIIKIPYFNALLSSGMKESLTKEVSLLDDDYEIYFNYLNFIYDKELIKNKDNYSIADICNLILLCDKVSDDENETRFVELFINKLNYDEIDDVFEMLTISHNPAIFNSTIKFINANYHICDFNKITYDIINKIINFKQVPQIIKLYYISKWGVNNPTHNLSSMLSFIKTDLLFTGRSSPLLSNIVNQISDSEHLQLLKFITKLSTNYFLIPPIDIYLSKIVTIDNFDINLLTFGEPHMIRIPNVNDYYYRMNLIYDGYDKWGLELPKCHVSILSTGETSNITTRYHLDKNNQTHKLFIEIMYKIYIKCAEQCLKNKSTFKIKCSHVDDLIQTGMFINPFNYQRDPINDEIVCSSNVDLYCKNKTNSKFIDYVSGDNVKVNVMDNFIATSSIITLNIYKKNIISLIKNISTCYLDRDMIQR